MGVYLAHAPTETVSLMAQPTLMIERSRAVAMTRPLIKLPSIRIAMKDPPFESTSGKPVTNQVTTPPGRASLSRVHEALRPFGIRNFSLHIPNEP